jgi:hypothetical protein
MPCKKLESQPSAGWCRQLALNSWAATGEQQRNQIVGDFDDPTITIVGSYKPFL